MVRLWLSCSFPVRSLWFPMFPNGSLWFSLWFAYGFPIFLFSNRSPYGFPMVINIQHFEGKGEPVAVINIQ